MTGARPARYRDVFASPQFRRLWLALILSMAGDQLARVAVTVLVFSRTHSPAWTALAYAMTFLPDLVGGSVLAGLADRFSRRTVMVAADLARMVLVMALALPGTPLPVQIGVLFAVQVMAVPFTAARSAVLSEVLTGDRLTVGFGILNVTSQLGLALGLGGGAAAVSALGTHGALVVDAVTFALSALLIGVGMPAYAPPAGTGTARPAWWTSARSGAAVVAARPRLRILLAIACLCGFYVVPEGLAVPYAAQIGAGTGGVGYLLVASPLGTVLGTMIMNRMRPDLRLRLLVPLAIASSAVLLPNALAPGLGVTVALWTLSGAASAHDSVTNAEFVRAAPEEQRALAVGLAVAALRFAQGAGVVLAGLAAQLLTPAQVIGIAAALGTAAGLAVGWRARNDGAGPAVS